MEKSFEQQNSRLYLSGQRNNPKYHKEQCVSFNPNLINQEPVTRVPLDYNVLYTPSLQMIDYFIYQYGEDKIINQIRYDNAYDFLDKVDEVHLTIRHFEKGSWRNVALLPPHVYTFDLVKYIKKAYEEAPKELISLSNALSYLLTKPHISESLKRFIVTLKDPKQHSWNEIINLLQEVPYRDQRRMKLKLNEMQKIPVIEVLDSTLKSKETNQIEEVENPLILKRSA